MWNDRWEVLLSISHLGSNPCWGSCLIFLSTKLTLSQCSWLSSLESSWGGRVYSPWSPPPPPHSGQQHSGVRLEILTPIHFQVFPGFNTSVVLNLTFTYQNNVEVSSPGRGMQRGVISVVMRIHIRPVPEQTLNDIKLLGPHCTVQWSFTILVMCINVCKEISKKWLPLYSIWKLHDIAAIVKASTMVVSCYWLFLEPMMWNRVRKNASWYFWVEIVWFSLSNIHSVSWSARKDKGWISRLIKQPELQSSNHTHHYSRFSTLFFHYFMIWGLKCRHCNIKYFILNTVISHYFCKCAIKAGFH